MWMEASTSTPLWLSWWIGLLAALAWIEASRGPLAPERLARSPGEGVGARGSEPMAFAWVDWPPRDLRVLPGIGSSRARDLADERWRRGPDGRDFELRELRGIGTRTQERVDAFLRDWGIRRPGGVDGGLGPGVVHSTPLAPRGFDSTDG